MKRNLFKKISNGLTILAMLLLTTNIVAFAQKEILTPSDKYYIVETEVLEDGTDLEKIIINGPPEPPPGYGLERTAVSLPEPNLEAGINVLTVPTFNWSHGCSATSAAMIAGYYDRNGYSNMYDGPTNGGVMPLDNSSWPDWVDGCGATRHNTPLSATKMGIDGRVTRGHVDDYWVCYGSSDPDPFFGNWTEHTHGDCTGDYMYTNQTSNHGASDGATQFWGYADATIMQCSDLEGWGGGYLIDGTLGLKNFYVSRGYTVDQCYYQRIDTDAAGGFSYQQYMAEIDAGRPVMFHVTGHTMVGVGYDDSSNLMYIHDTWDWSVHTMTWGDSYSGMDIYAVSIVTLAPAATPYGDELLVDFGTYGLWHYDGSSWSQLASWDPDADLAGWSGGLGVDFVEASGLWNFDGSLWRKIAGWDVDGASLAGWSDGLAVDFGTYGLWHYDGSSWSRLTSWNPDADLAGWSGGLAVDFGDYGLWSYDGFSWYKIAGWDVGGAGLAGWSDGLAVDFGTYGLWHYDGSAWSKLANWDPEDGLTGWSGGLAVDFGDYGLWSYDGFSWTKLGSWNPVVMAGFTDSLAVDFGEYGLWKYDGSSWSKLTDWNAENMGDCDLN